MKNENATTENTIDSDRFGPVLIGEFKPFPPRKIGNLLFLGYGNVPFGEKLKGRALMVFCGSPKKPS